MSTVQNAYQTEFTRTGKLNMKNRKPSRTPANKKAAHLTAARHKDGYFTSNVPVQFQR